MTIREHIQKSIRHLKRYNRVYFRNKFYDRSWRKYIESGWDLRRLDKDYPKLKQLYEQKASESLREIQPFYQEYVSGISSPVMAASFEISVFLLILCDLLKPRRIIDFGSGFSSFVFRFYSRQHAGTEVWSVDDSQEWLEKTGEFLLSKKMSADNLYSLASLRPRKDISFDLIFYDLGAFDTRMLNLEWVLGLLAKDGLLVLDDMHGADYAFFVREALRKSHFEKYSARYYTKDAYGRYAFLARHAE